MVDGMFSYSVYAEYSIHDETNSCAQACAYIKLLLENKLRYTWQNEVGNSVSTHMYPPMDSHVAEL